MSERPHQRGRPFTMATALVLLAIAIGPASTLRSAPAHAANCSGCGCKGGPGYRGLGGTCVGWKALDEVCGRPPTTRCKAEQVNAKPDGRSDAPQAPPSRSAPAPSRQPEPSRTVPNPF